MENPGAYQRMQSTTYIQSQIEQDEDELLQDLIGRLGTDKVRQYVQAHEEFDAAAEEWEQNFC